MLIIAAEDIDQTDKSDRKRLATCPNCGQKLFEVVNLNNRGAFRIKCRRCKKYIAVSVM